MPTNYIVWQTKLIPNFGHASSTMSTFLYSISNGPIPKHAFGLIVISKIWIWKSYQTEKQMKKIIIIIIIILIWNLKLHFGLKKCWTKWALKQLKKYKSLGYIIKFSILTKKKEKSAYKYGIGLKGKIFFWVIVFCWIKLYWEIWCWRYGNDIRRNPKFLFIYLFIYIYIYIYIIKLKPLIICWPHESLLHRI